jgi:hypothetical protein
MLRSRSTYRRVWKRGGDSTSVECLFSMPPPVEEEEEEEEEIQPRSSACLNAPPATGPSMVS